MYVIKKIKIIIPVIILTCVFTFSGYAAISSDADKYMARGEAAVENAQNTEDYKDAVGEFKKAIELAPDWDDAYYNLSVAQKGAGEYKDAIRSLKRYMELTGNEDAKKDAKRKIYKLEYLAEKKETRKPEEKPKSLAEQLEGTWYARFIVGSRDFYLPRNNPYTDTFKVEAYGNALKFIDMNPEYYKPYYGISPGEVLFRLNLAGTELSGIHHQRFRNTYGLNPPLDVSVIGDVSDDAQTIVLNYTFKYNEVWNKGNGVYVKNGEENTRVRVVLKRGW